MPLCFTHGLYSELFLIFLARNKCGVFDFGCLTAKIGFINKHFDTFAVKGVAHLIGSKTLAEINHNRTVEKTREVGSLRCGMRDKGMRK